MPRQTLNFTATDGRDAGKVYVITEMSSGKAEEWAMRALLALMGSGVEMPDGFERSGMAGMAELGFSALSRLSWETAKPLMDDMMSCIQIVPNPAKPHVKRELTVDDDIEEVSTRIKLRVEVWKLHTGFLKAVAPSIFQGSPAAVGHAAG